MEYPEIEKRAIQVCMTPEEWGHIDSLLKVTGMTLDQFTTRLMDAAQQGVYRSGANEREWLADIVGYASIEQAMAAYYDQDDTDKSA